MQTLQKRAVKTFAASAALTLGLVGCASTAEVEAPATDDGAPCCIRNTLWFRRGLLVVDRWWRGSRAQRPH